MATSIEFGYYPHPIECQVGDIQITTLPDLEKTVTDVAASENVEMGWVYEPDKRVFGLPQTHILEHSNADSAEHLSFLVWTLGFILGIRLSDTEAGFLDATPIEAGKLHDMALLGPNPTDKALEHAERFWQAHSADIRIAKGVKGIVTASSWLSTLGRASKHGTVASP